MQLLMSQYSTRPAGKNRNMIENATMFQEARRLAQENQVKVQKISTLYDVARALMSTVKTERLLQIMLYALISPGGLNFSRAILFNLCGHGHFDMSAYTAYLSGQLKDYEYPENEIAMALSHLPSMAG